MEETALRGRARQVAILAGGRGMRLRPLTLRLPKPMVPIGGRPFLEYQIEMLRRTGFDDVLLLTGYLGDVIEGHFRDGRQWQVRIRYSREESPLGTAGALKHAEALLDDVFLLLNGDTYLNIDYSHFACLLDELPASVVMAIYTNSDRIAPNNVLYRADRMISRYDKSDAAGLTHVDAGAYLLRKSVLDRIAGGRRVSLEDDVFPALARDRQLGGWPVDTRYYDMGTLARLALAEQVLA